MRNGSKVAAGAVVTVLGLVLVFIVLPSSGEITEAAMGRSTDRTKVGVQPLHPTSTLLNPSVEAPSNNNVFAGLVGKRAPDFTLEDLNGEKISLRSYRGKNVVLFFSEGVMCYPACWRQILGFGVDPRFRSDALAVVTILVDAKDEWKKATRVVPELASTITVFDSDHAVSKAYGVLDLPSSMHKGESPGHSYIIVDKNGIVRFVHDDVAMGMRNAELLEEIQKLNG